MLKALKVMLCSLTWHGQKSKPSLTGGDHFLWILQTQPHDSYQTMTAAVKRLLGLDCFKAALKLLNVDWDSAESYSTRGIKLKQITANHWGPSTMLTEGSS